MNDGVARIEKRANERATESERARRRRTRWRNAVRECFVLPSSWSDATASYCELRLTTVRATRASTFYHRRVQHRGDPQKSPGVKRDHHPRRGVHFRRINFPTTSKRSEIVAVTIGPRCWKSIANDDASCCKTDFRQIWRSVRVPWETKLIIDLAIGRFAEGKEIVMINVTKGFKFLRIPHGKFLLNGV